MLETDFPWLDDIYRPNRPPRLPTVLTEWAVTAILAEMKGVHARMALARSRSFSATELSTTMIYLPVLNRGGRGVVSPFDRLK